MYTQRISTNCHSKVELHVLGKQLNSVQLIRRFPIEIFENFYCISQFDSPKSTCEQKMLSRLEIQVKSI